MDRSASPEDNRVKQVLVGLAVLFGICSLIALGWIGRSLPGFVGEWFGVVVGIITTPVLMEASFIVLGLLIVISINYWRLHRDGDELVYLEQAEGALEIDYHSAALQAIAEMSDDERETPAVLELRIKIAKATGKDELAARLQRKLAALDH